MSTCETCRFYGRTRYTDARVTKSGGGCRRRAPGISPFEATATWPFVNYDDWCGDYEPKLLTEET